MDDVDDVDDVDGGWYCLRPPWADLIKPNQTESSLIKLNEAILFGAAQPRAMVRHL
jgi:hypothetical protein